jgi:hypothetical protein
MKRPSPNVKYVDRWFAETANWSTVARLVVAENRSSRNISDIFSG